MKRSSMFVAIALGAVLVVPSAAGAAFVEEAVLPAGAGAGKVALDLARDRIYVLNVQASTMTVFRASSQSVLGTVVVGSEPTALAVHEPSGRVYVTNTGSSHSVLVIDGLSVVDVISLDNHPWDIAYNVALDRFFVAMSAVHPAAVCCYAGERSSVYIIDPVLNVLDGILPGGFFRAGAIAFDTRRNRVVVGERSAVRVHDAVTRERIADIGSAGAFALTYDAARDRFIGSFPGCGVGCSPASSQTYAIDGATFARSVISADFAPQLAVDGRTGRIFAGRCCGGYPDVIVFDGDTLAPIERLVGAGNEVAFDPVGRRLYGGNASRRALVVIADDVVPPDTAISSSPQAQTRDVSAEVRFEGADDVAGALRFECSLDGAGFAACTSPATFGSLADGAHTTGVRAIDRAGNTDPSPARATWIVERETNVPGTTAGSGPPAVTASRVATFTFDGSDDRALAGFECALDGAIFSPCASPHTLNGLGAGAHLLRVRAVDASGNADPTPAEFRWTIDLTPPNTTLTAPPPPLTNASIVDVGFTGSDGVGPIVFECALDGAPYSSCTSPARFEGLAEGAHTISIAAVDAAGNADPTPALAQVRVDLQPPGTVLAARPPDPSVSTDATIAFGGSDDLSSASELTFRCAVDGASPSTCRSPLTLTGLPSGTHEVVVAAVDRAGNVDPAGARASWAVDANPPLVEMPPEVGPARVDVVVSGISGTSAVVRLDDQDGSTPASSGVGVVAGGRVTLGMDVSQLSEGEITASVVLRDAAGNRTPEALARGKKDTTPPSSVTNTQDGAVLVATPVWGTPIRGTATDAVSGVAEVLVTYRPSTPGSAGTTVAARLICGQGPNACTWDAQPPLVPGRYAVSVSARDAFGNGEAPPPGIEVVVV